MNIEIMLTKNPKEKPAEGSKLGFGSIFTDHMFIMEYNGDVKSVSINSPIMLKNELNMLKKVKQIIYISCDPETLARDLKYLSKQYSVGYVQPVDMFPMTAHVETVVCLQIIKK